MKIKPKDKGNAKCKMMNDEAGRGLSKIIRLHLHHSSFIIHHFLAASLLITALAFASCAPKVTTNPQPPPAPPMPPEQKLAIAKVGAIAASAILAIEVSNLQKLPVANATKIKWLSASKAILDEFNIQLADVTVIDLTTRDGVKAAIDKALRGFDDLLTGDFLNLDPGLQANLRALIIVARSALASFDVLFPATTPQ